MPNEKQVESVRRLCDDRDEHTRLLFDHHRIQAAMIRSATDRAVEARGLTFAESALVMKNADPSPSFIGFSDISLRVFKPLPVLELLYAHPDNNLILVDGVPKIGLASRAVI